MDGERKGALEGIRVVEVAIGLTGAFVGKYLSDFGAEVIKIESQSSPCVTRCSSPFKDGISGLNRSGSFPKGNSGKCSFGLNLRTNEGNLLAKKLITSADVVVENLSPGVMSRLGLGYEELKKVKPDIIMVSLSMQGQDGPYAKHASWGFNLKALAGFTHLSGWPDRPAVGPTNPYTDQVAPWYGVVSLMAALAHRRKTGEGQYIDISQLECSLHFLYPALLDYAVNGRVQMRMGNRSTRTAPHGAYPCMGKDCWCVISAYGDEEWQSFSHVIGDPEWTREAKFATLLARKKNEDELDQLVGNWTMHHSALEVMEMMQEVGVPAGVVQTPGDLVAWDPHLKERECFQTSEFGDIGAYKYITFPPRLSKTPSQIRPAPTLGQHTEYVCTELLNLSDEEFVELMRAGVVEIVP